MRILEVTLKGIGTHYEETVLDLENANGRLIVLTGDNQAGKTMALEAVMATFYGSLPTRVGSLYNWMSFGESEAELSVRFEAMGSVYLATRTLKRTEKVKSQRTFLDRISDGIDENYEPLRIAGPGAKDFEEKIQTLVGSMKLAKATWFLCQDGSGSLVDARAGGRKEIFAEVLMLSGLQEKSEKFKFAHGGESARLIGLRGQITGRDYAKEIEGTKANLNNAMSEARELRNDSELVQKRLNKANKTIVSLEAKMPDFNALRRSVHEAYDLVEAVEGRISAAQKDQEEKNAQAGALSELIEMQGEHAEWLEWMKSIEAEEKNAGLYNEWEREFDLLSKRHERCDNDLVKLHLLISAKESPDEADKDICERCNLYQMRDGVQASIDDADAAAKEARKALLDYPKWDGAMVRPDLDERASKMREKAYRYEGLDTKAALAEVAAKRASEIGAELITFGTDLVIYERKNTQAKLASSKAAEDAKESIRLMDEAGKDKDRFQADISAFKRDLSRLDSQVGGIKNELKNMSIDKEKEETAKKDTAALELRVNRLSVLKNIFGKNGVQPLLIDNAAPEVEALANGILADICGGRMSVAIETLVNNEDGGTREDFEINVTRNGWVDSIDICGESKGGKKMLSLAMSAAMCIFATRVSGVRPESLFVDEGFDGLTVKNKYAMMEALDKMSNQFASVMSVTHDPDLADRAPARIKLITNGRPRVVGVEVS